MTSRIPVPPWLLLLCYCVLLPCVLPRHIYELWRRNKRSQSTYEPRIKPLGSRERIPGTLKSVKEQQNLLFEKLPYDIRLIFWRLVLEPDHVEDVLHLDLYEGSVQAKRCLARGRPESLASQQVCCAAHFEGYKRSFLAQSAEYYYTPGLYLPYKHICWYFAWTKADQKKRTYLSGSRKLLPLLLTCKQIYTECAATLYETNVFDIRRAECVTRLPVVLPARVLENIRHIHFSTAFPWVHPSGLRGDAFQEQVLRTFAWQGRDDPTKWRAACDVFATLKLKSLHIVIQIGESQEWSSHIRDIVDHSSLAILQPLSSVRAPDFTVIVFPGVSQTVVAQLGPVPFQIIQNDDLTRYTGMNTNVEMGADQ